MKRISLLIILLFTAVFLFSQSADISTSNLPPNVALSPSLNAPKLEATGSVLYDNGPLVNSIATGSGGADESVLENSLGLLYYGTSFQLTSNYSLTDDFTLLKTSNIHSVVLYGYQTNSSITSTISGVYIRLWDGIPGSGGSIIWGDFTTNRLLTTDWTGIYRVNEGSSGNTQRPIMGCNCEMNTVLQAGTYWIEYSMTGTLSSGPWCPPISIAGVATTGNALQSSDSGATFVASESGVYQQGFPFVLLGASTVPFNKYFLITPFFLIGIGIFLKRRIL
ncbi:MAG: hypothetical protein PF541_05530 [Prolixibacteraceae bacterium]|jgi:hypothetical protein|nr:hypothetical protein [Prolixibacteraceae bacterium]